MIEAINGVEAARLFLLGNSLKPVTASLDFLHKLVRAFSALPYENVSKIIKSVSVGDPYLALRLPEEVVIDHFERGFGGTCFSLTFLLDRIMRFAGFSCYKVMADMRSGRNVHCLLIVEHAGTKHLVDPGYAICEVVRLPVWGSSYVECPHATVEVVREGEQRYSLWTTDRSGRRWRYSFTDLPADDPEFERYWIDSFTKPTLNNLCLTRMTPNGHLYFRKDFLKLSSRHAITKSKVKWNVEKLIADKFGIEGQWVNLALELLRKRGKGCIG